MSSPYEHIVCCFEGSEPSRQALAEARRLRARGPGRLTVLHVARQPLRWGTGIAYAVSIPEPFEEEAQRVREWLVHEVADDQAAVVVISGYPPAAACDWAAANGADLIVAAAHRGLVDRVLLGSFAGFLVRHSPCPVLLIRPQPPTRNEEPSAVGSAAA